MNHCSRFLIVSLISLAGCSRATDSEQFKPPRDAGETASDAGDGDAVGDGADSDAGGQGMDGGPAEEGQIDVELGDDALGSVTSDPEGIDCGETCSAVFPEGTEVVLTAHPHPTAVFTGWGGACAAEKSTTCVLTAGEPHAVSASFTLDWFDVTVSRHGSGSVSSSDGMLRCDGSSDEVCSVRYPRGATVTLSASPSAGSTFSGWSGACAGLDDSCVLEVTGSKLVNAVFDAEGQVSLLVSKLGNGNGAITSGDDPASIECGVKCAANFDPSQATQVVLHAMADGSSEFKGFSGDCTPVSGEPTQCAVTMDAVKRVSATFELKQHELMVAWNGEGEGSVVAELPAGLACEKPASCEASYQHGTVVRLKAEPAQGSSFREWSLASCGSAEVCEISMLGPTLVVATFDVSSFDLTSGVLGNGQLLCNGGPCEESYPYGTEITVSALPGSGHELKSWQQVCAGTPATEDCVFTISEDTQVVAQFGPKVYQVTVEVEGNGTVSGDLACDEASSPCVGTANHGDALALTATAAAEHEFVGWTGGGCGGDAECSVDPVTGDVSLTATFVKPVPNTTTVSLSKTGKGSVSAAPAASPGTLDCDVDCAGANGQYVQGTVVTLTATPAPGYGQAVFSGVTCGDAPPAGTCTFTTAEAVQNVSVAFEPLPQAVQVTLAGAGQGTVTSEPAGIDCGDDCSGDFPFDSGVKLTATPAEHSVFTGWSGGCTGAAPTCELTVGDENEVTATFEIKNYTLTVQLAGDGVGGAEPLVEGPSVSCTRNGTGGCKAVLPAGTPVVLTANAPKWATFSGFSHNGFKLTGDITVTATFSALGALAFVTSVQVPGDFAPRLGALEGDELCTTLAMAKGVGLPGPWVAWLSDGKSQPIPTKEQHGRLQALTSATPIIRVDGAFMLSGGFAQLANSGLDNPLNVDETGKVHLSPNKAPVRVWTATSYQGRRLSEDSPYCTNWRSTTDAIHYGVGNAMSVDAQGWSYRPEGGPTGLSCSRSARLYCFRDISVKPVKR